MSKNTTVVDMRKFVEARNGEVFTSTRQVAEAFEKLHNHVIAKVRALECSAQFLTDNFSSVQFEHRGNTYEAFEMTKDGFMFLVMSFTGKKAAAIKEGYIAAFNWMAAQLGLSSKSLVAKAVSEALGAEGARTLSNVMRCRVAKLDAEHQRSATAKLASALHARFDVPRMELIPADKMDAACNFIASYAIEGEYIPRQSSLIPEKLGECERYLISADPKGNTQITPVPMGAFVLTRQEFMQSMLVDRDMPVSTAEMFQFVALATENLRIRSLSQARKVAA
ncbi:Rha family transcriptional regulator [Pseudomonas sp. ANT_J12]|uniref:Rha family transcriptional regulator n=1 Tax=Pseudomonas sp. ANT_J12 TaxID=2597351 RepID=UPI0011F3386E|nr:Rha family transcriptional regulator [Pseudomonas sp. ANT_J12]KAA0995434.1 Rha family transcriptional regulator [Pseudomonas sp. ANT_J12]